MGFGPMEPEIFEDFVTAFTTELNRAQADRAAVGTARQAELQKVHQQIERLIDAIADGTPAAAVNGRLASQEGRRIALEAEVKKAVAPAPQLHPNLAEVYRQKVATLVEGLARDDAGKARELVRSLIEWITLYQEDEGQRVEIRGELAAILAL
jgi:site-specific DNA recombinase